MTSLVTKRWYQTGVKKARGTGFQAWRLQAEEDGFWMLGNSREAGMAQHLITHWLMEYSTENYKLKQPAVF